MDATQTWADLSTVPVALALAADSSQTIPITVTIPSEETSGAMDELIIRATSRANPRFLDSVKTTTLVVDNELPNCDAGGPYTEECADIISIQLDGSSSSDPEGDLLSYSWATDCPGATIENKESPTTVLAVDTQGCEACTVSLTIDDGRGQVDCLAIVNVVPALFVSADEVPGDPDDDETTLVVAFGAQNLACGPVEVSGAIDIGCQTVPVFSGERIDLECDDRDCTVDNRGQIPEIEALSAILRVVGVDECGNVQTASFDLCTLVKDVPDNDD